MRKSGLTEIIPLICISALCGWDPSFFLSAYHLPNHSIVLLPGYLGELDEYDILVDSYGG